MIRFIKYFVFIWLMAFACIGYAYVPVNGLEGKC